MLCVFHTVGDFYSQTAGMAEAKKTKMKILIVHAFLYAFFMGAVFAFAPFWNALICWAIISLSHFIIDKCRIVYEKKHEKKELISFIVDQILHVLIILGCFQLFMRGKTGIVHRTLYTLTGFRDVLVYISILSIIIKPASIFVSKVFEYQAQKAEKNTNNKTEDTEPVVEKSGGGESKIVKTEEKKKGTSFLGAGTLIGVLERIIIVILVLLNEPGAIGFVLTAKSIARVSQLKEDEFAEKYLIGTLISVVIALGTVLLIPKLI